MDFDAAYLPAGSTLRLTTVALCENVVVAVIKNYAAQGGVSIEV